MLAAAATGRQARFHDRQRAPRPRAALDGLPLLYRRARRQLSGATPIVEIEPWSAARARRLTYGVFQPAMAREIRRRAALAVAVDPAAACPGPLAGARGAAQEIESAARMAHNAAPPQKLQGNEWRAVRLLVPYLAEYKWRVLLALACLITAKLANVGVPLVMKAVLDRLDVQTAMVAVPVALLATYGILRFSTTLFGELRDVLFVRVTQRAIRRVALGVFRHLHSLSLRFHLERQTGGMTRDIERGTRGISTLLSYLVFSILPVILEFSLVAVVLLAKFDWRFAAVTFGAVVIYIGFTVAVTE